jgi:hypothetical protein
MQYFRVEWIHSFPDEPVDIYFETDDEGWETRKVEFFPDGSVGYAYSTRQKGTTGLAEVKMCPIEEIATQPEFKPHVISREDFESVWQRNVDY